MDVPPASGRPWPSVISPRRPAIPSDHGPRSASRTAASALSAVSRGAAWTLAGHEPVNEAAA